MLRWPLPQLTGHRQPRLVLKQSHIPAMQGETGDERLIETVDLGVSPGGGALQEKRVSLEAEHSGEVRFSASCRWQSP